jgi:hypothetical protein
LRFDGSKNRKGVSVFVCKSLIPYIEDRKALRFSKRGTAVRHEAPASLGSMEMPDFRTFGISCYGHFRESQTRHRRGDQVRAAGECLRHGPLRALSTSMPGCAHFL